MSEQKIFLFVALLAIATTEFGCLDRPVDQRNWDQIEQKGESLFMPLEFQGEIISLGQVQCGGPKIFCLKVLFRRTDSGSQIDTSVNYGFVQLIKPELNILMTGTRLRVSMNNNPPRGINMPIQAGDKITKSKGEKYFTVYSQQHNRAFQIEPIKHIEGDYNDNYFWEIDLLKME